MKVKRRKAVKRILEFYLVNFGIKTPLKVIADGPYLCAACAFGKDLLYDLENYMGVSAKVFVTPGVLRELEAIGEPVKDALALAKTLEVVPTSAPDDASAVDCILSLLGNDNPQKFSVASNDKSFGLRVREIPGVPVLYFNRDVFVLDPPAPASQRRVKERNRDRIASDIRLANEAVAAVAAKRGGPKRPGGPAAQAEEDEEEEEPQKKRHRHKARGPNPLAMKKKKKPAAPGKKAGGASASARPVEGDGAQGKKKTRRGRRKKGGSTGAGDA